MNSSNVSPKYFALLKAARVVDRRDDFKKIWQREWSASHMQDWAPTPPKRLTARRFMAGMLGLCMSVSVATIIWLILKAFL